MLYSRLPDTMLDQRITKPCKLYVLSVTSNSLDGRLFIQMAAAVFNLHIMKMKWFKLFNRISF